VTAQVWIALLVGIAAIIDDLSRRRISNWIPSSAFVAGLTLQGIQNGWRGVGSALLGTLAGGGVFLIFYLLGGMGGGDIKLMAGFGAILGVKRLLEAALWTAGCGGLMAVGFVCVSTVRDFWRRRSSAESAASQGAISGQRGARQDSIPYAPAIAAGVWLSLVPKA